jgi:hypothetical protein
VDDIHIPAVCPALGISVYTGDSRLGGTHSPSLELIDPARGYVAGNVVILSALARRIGSDAAPAELLAIADFYEALGAQ